MEIPQTLVCPVRMSPCWRNSSKKTLMLESVLCCWLPMQVSPTCRMNSEVGESDHSSVTLFFSSGTCSAGHTDKLNRLKEVCDQSGLWLHVEGWVSSVTLNCCSLISNEAGKRRFFQFYQFDKDRMLKNSYKSTGPSQAKMANFSSQGFLYGFVFFGAYFWK